MTRRTPHVKQRARQAPVSSGGAWRRDRLVPIELRLIRSVAACFSQSTCVPGGCGACRTLRTVLKTPLACLPGHPELCVFEPGHTPEGTPTLQRVAGAGRSGPARLLRLCGDLEPLLCQLSAGRMVRMESGGERGRDPERVLLMPLFSGKTWLGALAYAGGGKAAPRPDVHHLLQVTADIVGGMLGRRLFMNQFLQTQKMETLGHLAGGLAHDLNNVFAGIRAAIQLLQLDSGGKPQMGEDLAAVQREIQRAADLVRQLLVFSQPATQRMQPVDLNGLVKHMTHLFRRTLPKDITIQFDLAPDGAWTRIDPVQFEQVLLNLVLNARDAMPGGGLVTLATSLVNWTSSACVPVAGGKKGRYACLSVTDHGSGIAAEDLPMIFEPFFSTKKDGKGTGLGLSVVQSVVNRHGGCIQVESHPGEGTTLRCYLPAVKPKDGEATSTSAGMPAADGWSITVLLVDDQATVSRFLGKALERYGCRVITALDGRQAVELYKQGMGTIDLVLLDIGLPVMDGRECLRELLAVDPQAKVIMMSGYHVEGDEGRLLESGAKAFLQKPFDVTAAVDIMRQVLAGATPSR